MTRGMAWHRELMIVMKTGAAERPGHEAISDFPPGTIDGWGEGVLGAKYYFCKTRRFQHVATATKSRFILTHIASPHRSSIDIGRTCLCKGVINTSRSNSFLKSRFAEGLRGTLRDSVAHKGQGLRLSWSHRHRSARSSVSKDLAPLDVEEEEEEEFYIVTKEDLHPPSFQQPRPRSKPDKVQRQLERADELGSIPLRNRPSDISDLTTCFPKPPTHIPLPITPEYINLNKSFEGKSNVSKKSFASRPSPLNPTTHQAKSSHTRSASEPALLPQNRSKLAFFRNPFQKLVRKFSRKPHQQAAPAPPATTSEDQESLSKSSSSSSSSRPRIIYKLVHPNELHDPQQNTDPKYGYIGNSPRTSFNPSSPSWLSRNVSLSHTTPVHHSYAEFTGSLRDNSFAIPPEFNDLHPSSKQPRTSLATSPSTSQPLPRRHYRPPTPPKRHNQPRSRAPSAPESILGDLASTRPSYHRRSQSSPASKAPFSQSITPLSYASTLPRVYYDRTGSPSTSLPINNSLLNDPPSISQNQNHHQPAIIDHPADTNHHTMDYSGKRTDVVDFGGETDYTGVQWFADPPIRPQQQQQQQQHGQQPEQAYAPSQSVIEQNAAFEFALSVAPNELYARYKQYGQLGVLAWCSEFAELIDGLKGVGFQGNMFVTTREQALRTCEEVLKVKLEIKMQIIIMYLSSQVARLRRFLDGDKQWNDYPPIEFPLDPQSYT